MDTQGIVLMVLGATFAAVTALAGVVAGLYRRELVCQEKLSAVTAELAAHREISETMHAENVERLNRIERALQAWKGPP